MHIVPDEIGASVADLMRSLDGHRFSSKEEDRRVVAAVYDPKRIDAEQAGFENHTNLAEPSAQVEAL
jgi:hypothetical protein